MSINSTQLNDKRIRSEVTEYFTSKKYPTVQQTAEHFQISHHTITAILKQTLPPGVFIARKRANYSRSKKAEKNPMYGLRFDRVNIRGGYKARWRTDRYVQEHRSILMECLGLAVWPEGWEVHHINNNPEDNRPDNLCIATKKGHANLHGQKLAKLKLWEKEEFGTLKLEKIIATLQED